MPKIRPKPNDIDFLRAIYKKAETEVINEIFRKRLQGYVDYAEYAALQRIQAILQGMVDESWQYVPKVIKKRFDGVNTFRQGYANAESLAAVTSGQTALMEQLTDNLMGNIMESATVAYSTAQKLYKLARLNDDDLRKVMLTSTAYTEALGKGAFTSARLMESTVRAQGLTGYVDAAGRHWSLYDYCNMATRTTARQAEVAAVLSADEHDLYKILKIGSTCPLCAVYEGRVYSKSGTDPNYPPLSMAFGKIDPNGGDDLSNTYLNIHPNCLHTLVKFTEMGMTEKQIQKIREFSNPETNPLDVDPRSKKQIKAYREKENNRRRYLNELKKQKAEKAEKSDNFKAEQTKITNKGLSSENQYAVNARFVNSQKYHAQFENKGFNKPTKEKAIEYGRQILEKADGTENEYLIAFDAKTGNRIIDNMNRTAGNLKTGFTDPEREIILKNRNKIILMHNHPGSLRPSGTDICTVASESKIEASIIACHNGDLFVIKDVNPTVPSIFDKLTEKAKSKGYNAANAKIIATSELYELNQAKNNKLFTVLRGDKNG